MDHTITGATQLFALIGYPVSHSISPIIQNSIFAAKQADCKYILLKTPPDTLRESVTVLKGAFGGFNVTIPHKQAVMNYLDEIDPKAQLYGAVNTVKNDNGRLIGYNTDGYGFIKAFDLLNIAIENKKILLLGAGGGARAVLCELLQRQCDVTIVNRTADKAKKLQKELSIHLPGSITVCEAHEIDGEYDCLINTTSVGLSNTTEMFPIDPDILSNIKVVYDLIYNPHETKLLREAKNRGCIIINGFPMLFYQAMASNHIWTDLPIDEDVEKELFCQIREYLQALQQKK